MLTTHLKLRKVLVVIDDADDVTRIKSLLPRCELHPESLVIVTSRKKKILEAHCTLVSEVQLLPEGHDMQLFKAWAFAAGQPVWDTSVLLPEVVACCGRLPLTLKVATAYAVQCVTSLHKCTVATRLQVMRPKARVWRACLQVMGAHMGSLRGQEREQEMWLEALEMLRSAEDLPEEEERLFASLRISYDALKDTQKRMFLDAPFFFLGRCADTAINAWQGCG